MWKHQERVLIGLIWILRRIASLSCESKLSHAVIELLACLARLDRLVLGGCGDLFRDGGSYVVGPLTLTAFRLWNLIIRSLHACLRSLFCLLLLLRHVCHVLLLCRWLCGDELSFMVCVSRIFICKRCNLISAFAGVHLASTFTVLLSVPFACYPTG